MAEFSRTIFRDVEAEADPAPIIVIDFNEERYWGDCSMCGDYRRLDHAVAWYCGPVHVEIGEQVPGWKGEAIAGGMCVCKECHDWHYAPTVRDPLRGGVE